MAGNPETIRKGGTHVVKNTRYAIILVALALVLIWNVLAWAMARNYYLARGKEVIAQRVELSHERAEDMADSIRRNLNYLGGIPDLMSQQLRVRNAVIRFGADRTPSGLPLEVRKKRWTEDAKLNDLSRYLAVANTSLNTDIIFLVDAGGDCIAASNWDKPGNTIGTNFVDRDYFQENKNGRRGMQYAVGKTTHISGLYFSTPVIIGGRFMGTVVAKTDVPNLSFLIKELDAFIADENGVIVLARDKKLEMRSLPGASVAGMPEQKTYARYRRSDFPVLRLDAWGNKDFPSLVRVQGETVPHVMSSKDVPQYGLKVHVMDEIGEIITLSRDASLFAFLLGLSGSVLILIAGGAILYWASVKRAEFALSRANLAERRIISISEDTQQRIGQELHDDLGQLLTGVAFMSEVLSSHLKNNDRPEAWESAKITALIKDAISKTRALAQGLFPVEMKEAGLSAMLSNLAKNVAATYEVKCEFICHDEEACRIDDPLAAINLFRIAQEALNNAVKHSGATKIALELIAEPDAITLEVADNGTGIRNPEGEGAGQGVGMRSMQYRASLLGASLHIDSLPGGGTSVVVHLPLKSLGI